MTADLDQLTTEELRRRAFDKAHAAHDLHFFWDLVRHMRGSRSIVGEDGSSGALTGTISELIGISRELMGHELGEDEPLLRARFLDYLRA